MKRILSIAAVFLLSFLLITTHQIRAEEITIAGDHFIQTTDWQKFSENLVVALNSCNCGLQVSALQKVIKYSNQVTINKAIKKIVRLYRCHPDLRVRRLALVTIHAVQNEWAIGIVKRDLPFESNPKMKKLMQAVITGNKKEIMKNGDVVSFLNF